MRRLFRLSIILIILLGISNYTNLFDNTKIKPFLDRVTTIIKHPQSIWSSSNSPTSTTDDEIVDWQSWESLADSATGAQEFGVADELWGAGVEDTTSDTTSIDPSNDEEVTEVNQQTVKKIANFKVQNCISPRGKFVPRNNYIIAYQYRSSQTCARERRYCVNGKLDGSFNYDTCYYQQALQKQQSNASLSISEINQIKKEYGLVDVYKSGYKQDTTNWWDENKDNLNGEEAWPGMIIDSRSLPSADQSPESNGSFISANKILNDPNKHFLGKPTGWVNILSNGQTELNNNVFKTWSLKKQLIWGGWESFISDYKTLTARSSYERKICFTPRWTIISNGQFVTAFKSHEATLGRCEIETRFCIDGNLQWSYTHQSCNGKYPDINNKPWGVDLSNTATVRWDYQSKDPLSRRINDLDYMPAPKPTEVQPINTEDTIQPVWWVIYHQPDEVNHDDQIPEYQFIPYETDHWYTESIIVNINEPLVVPEPSWWFIYHQPDEINHDDQVAEYQFIWQ